MKIFFFIQNQRGNNLKTILLISSIGLFLAACGNQTAVNSNAVTVVNSTNPNAAVNAKENSANAATPANTASPANTNKTAETNTAKPADNNPQRVSFSKGQSFTTENLTLAPGASKQFIVGAKKGQFLVVEPDSNNPTPDELKVTLLTKGKATIGDLSEFLSATLNADGDYVFEVKNVSKKEIKTPLRVQIDDGPQ